MKTYALVALLCFSVFSYADQNTHKHVIAGAICQVATDLVIAKSMRLEGNDRFYTWIMTIPMCALISVATEGAQSMERNKPFDKGDQGAFMGGQAIGAAIRIPLDF
jgi:hypothetical protein